MNARFTLPAPFADKSCPTGLFIGRKWTDTKKRIAVDNPATGGVPTQIADGDAADALRAVDAAAAALPGWAATAPRVRAEILRACYARMVAEADWLAFLIALENGKALGDAKGEVLYAAEFFRWYSEEAARVLGEVANAPSGSNRILVEYQPIGVALLVTP